jgi:predicted GIY-YIG superfamily endonuclease
MGYEQFTSKGVPWKLIWTTEKEDLSQAIILENKLKNLGRVQIIKFMLKYHQGVAGPDDPDALVGISGC